MDSASLPEILIIPIPPLPGGVATAVIVESFILNLIEGEFFYRIKLLCISASVVMTQIRTL